jgi:long-chain acyl-CoA synthetase
MPGYWHRPDETAKTLTPDGWLRTGDGGYIDEDGYIFLTDRLKDVIISGGENIYPMEIENILASHPAVAEVAVIGVPSERWGETVKAIVVLKPGQTAVAGDLIEHCSRSVAAFKRPTSVDFVEALPRNPTGKLLKAVLREKYWQGQKRNIA